MLCVFTAAINFRHTDTFLMIDVVKVYLHCSCMSKLDAGFAALSMPVIALLRHALLWRVAVSWTTQTCRAERHVEVMIRYCATNQCQIGSPCNDLGYSLLTR